MATMVKSSGQVTVVDITDGYSVGQTVENWTIPATSTAGSTTAVQNSEITTTVFVYRGSENVQTGVTVTQSEIKIYKPDGTTTLTSITPTVSTTNNQIKIKLKVTNTLTTGGIVRIPVKVTHVDGETLTFNRDLVFAIARTGAQGPEGPGGQDGKDAIVISITANPSAIIRNSSQNVTLTAHVYKGGIALNSSDISSLGTLNWYDEKYPNTIIATTDGSYTLSKDRTQLIVEPSVVQSSIGITVKLEAQA